MELAINIFQRNLSFKLHNKVGDNLDDLITVSSKEKITSIILSGESRSYTFLRQIALFCNLTAELNDCEIILKTKSYVKMDKSIAPIYE